MRALTTLCADFRNGGRVVLAFLGLLGFACCGSSGQPDARYPESAAASQWWSDIRYLADDSLQGRLAGSAGYQRAADYVVAEFKRYGLQPAGSGGYFQRVRLISQTLLPEKSSFSLCDLSNKCQTLEIRSDLISEARIEQPRSIDAPLVFIGYGLHIPSAGYDDFVGRDLRGKIAVTVNGGPAELSGAVKAHARFAEIWKALERAGAVGLIGIPRAESMDIRWSRVVTQLSQPGMYLAAPQLRQTAAPRFTATFNPAQAEKLFEHSGHTFAEVAAAARAGKPVAGFPLNLSLKGVIATRTEQLQSANVLAKLPGADPVLSNEYVVVSAHLDHLGVGEPINGDPIYHGAMDDASGVATVLEVARGLRESHAPLERSVLFAIFTAEEEVNLGSRAFTQQPTVPRDSMVADINIDMPLPLWPLRHLFVPGVAESSLVLAVRSVASARGYEVGDDPQVDRNYFIRTDQYSFVLAGIPAVSINFGFAPASAEEQTRKQWLTTRYHSPADNVSQPVDLHAAAAFNEFILALAAQVANTPQRPEWAEQSLFRQFANPR
jgi:Zn-dependent M28 family amino/carboxypeptidase